MEDHDNYCLEEAAQGDDHQTQSVVRTPPLDNDAVDPAAAAAARGNDDVPQTDAAAAAVAALGNNDVPQTDAAAAVAALETDDDEADTIPHDNLEHVVPSYPKNVDGGEDLPTRKLYQQVENIPPYHCPYYCSSLNDVVVDPSFSLDKLESNDRAHYKVGIHILLVEFDDVDEMIPPC